jgi:hypothetical protein
VAFIHEHFTTSSPEGAVPKQLEISRDRNYAILSYRRPSGGFGQTGLDYTGSGIRHALEHSPDLAPGSWQPLPASMFDPIGLPGRNGDGTETVKVRAPLGVNSFFRLHTSEE